MMMSVLPLVLERRAKRGANTYATIRLQLEHLTTHHDVRLLALSDANGLVLASSGTREHAEALAAYSPVLGACVDPGRWSELREAVARHMPLEASAQILVRPFFVDGQRLYLSVVGSRAAALEAALYRALAGMRCIFRQNLGDL
ncbi:MAG: hypothetical protein AAGI01_10950 [Myxococcota bacterium]